MQAISAYSSCILSTVDSNQHFQKYNTYSKQIFNHDFNEQTEREAKQQ